MDGAQSNSGFPLDPHEMVNGQACYSNNTQKLPIRNVLKSRLRDVRDLENGNNGENVDVKDGVSENHRDGIMGDKEDCKDGIVGGEEYGEDGVSGVEEGCVDKTKSNDIVQLNECMDDEEDEEDSSGDSDDEEDDDEDNRKNGNGGIVDAERRTRKRKLKSLALSYEFAPRVPPPSAEVAPPPPVTKLSSGGRNSLTDWTERETFVLLEALRERFLQHGKRSLRADEWKEVAERVSKSETSRVNRLDSQCRNRLDTLKKKYKKEKSRLAEMGGSSKWVYFSEMDMLMSSSAAELTGLSGGLDLQEDGFGKPGVYANGMDKKRDTPGNSQSSQKEEEDSDGLPPKKRKSGRESSGNFRLLECSFKKFTKIYEKMENRRAQQMIELEKMRNQFQKDLEMERQQITNNAQAEIARIRLGDRHDETSIDN
ncbi:hypothetical protein MLD38_030192 [Melastoma candidum]|uniref:Uncharacterized protein n=1 Tax=Melastoma candidum TaxID=119954 RepID=A0ACB9MLJ1_9MYRT|nr:hypothetical protein MLD38_030192 [Melastoma candidum]